MPRELPTPETDWAIFLMGPTASGKTDLAVELCQHLPCDIISVDSALVYRGMDIGTAKPNAELLARAPHRLINILEPWENYSVAAFYQDAVREMQAIRERGRIPLLVGGTMLYFRALRDGIAALPSANQAVRAEISTEAKLHGWTYVHQQLAKVDPQAAARIKPGDPQRLQRAMEVYRVSGKTMTELWAEQATEKATAGYAESAACPPIPYRLVNLAIAPAERAALHERIALRFKLMLDAGFLDEMKCLRSEHKLQADMPSMRCVGYRQAWDYLDGNISYDEMEERGIIATRQLAKRQLTWLRSWPELHWLETGDKKVLDKALKIIKDPAS